MKTLQIFFVSATLVAAVCPVVSAQETACADVCAQFGNLTDEQKGCMGGVVEALGYPLSTTPVCAAVDTNEQCLVCVAALGTPPEVCTQAHNTCIGAQIDPSFIAGLPVREGYADTTELDALRDLANRSAFGDVPVDAGAVGGTCAGACACTGSNNCTMDCPTGSCQYHCSGSSECNLGCTGGACAFNCSGSSDCTIGCAGGNCSFGCSGSSDCVASCAGGGCAMACTGSAECAFTCAGGNCTCSGAGCP